MNDQEIINILDALINITDISKILNTFIKAFEKSSILKEDNNYYLHGNFNLGGTVSGRLSSSKPNLQNIPSTGSKYAKHIKKCFKSTEGWILAGADFNALEARIGTLLTKDPAKLGVYIDGFDSHSFNAFGYWKDKMPDIQDALIKADNSNKFYKITHNDGTITYHTEDEDIVKELL